MSEQAQVALGERRGQLGAALEREMEMDAADAREIAGVVLTAFNGAEELDDREIGSDLRSVFYELEEHKLLAFRRETFRNEDGHERRAFFWTIRWDEVRPTRDDEAGSAEAEDSVYDELPSKAWNRRAEA